MLTYLDAINLLENSINAFLDKGPKGMGNQAVSLSELLANHGIEDSDIQSKVAKAVGELVENGKDLLQVWQDEYGLAFPTVKSKAIHRNIHFGPKR